MKFRPLKIPGVVLIEPEPLRDERGFFARVWCEREFEAQGLSVRLAQSSISYNEKKGTLRGIHFQRAPWEETKIVRCTAGSVFDVVVDLRAESPTYRMHEAVVLSSRERSMLYIPKGCAHGFQTLEDGTEVLYWMDQFYEPSAASGVRWNDPSLAIEWPQGNRIVSANDQALPLLRESVLL